MSRPIRMAISFAVLLLVALAGGQWLPTGPMPDSALPTDTADVADAREQAAIDATLALIESGGPFPYRLDGGEFFNREDLLPNKRAGYYREFTVPTPGSPDRGARRLVVGDGGEIYFTDDHYRSFVRLR